MMESTKSKNGCRYCLENDNLLQSNADWLTSGEIVYINKNGYLNSESDGIHMCQKINYCPMCGRRLNNGTN